MTEHHASFGEAAGTAMAGNADRAAGRPVSAASFGAAAGAAMTANARQAAAVVSRCDVDWHTHPDGVYGSTCRPDPVAGGAWPEDEA